MNVRAPAGAARGYWDPAPFARALLDQFSAAVSARRHRDAEHRYQVAAAYCRRTLGIVRSALDDGDDALADTALRNFLVLHDATVEMRRRAPRLVPDTAVIGRHGRTLLLEDRILEVMDHAAAPLTSRQLARRLADGGRTTEGELRLVGPHLDALLATGHLSRDDDGRLRRTGRRHVGVELGSDALDTLLGPRMRRLLHEAGIHSVGDVVADPVAVTEALGDVFAQRDTVDAFLLVAQRLAREAHPTARANWPDDTVRDYQRDAFDALRAGGYRSLVLDAPAGSGKTLVGALCITDWLEHLATGESILVLVPSVTIQRQWVRELCYAPIGPMLPPHLVTTGTMTSLLATHRRARVTPAVVVITYAAVAGAASVGGELDRRAVERLLQGLDVRYVLLDEVHVAAERPGSITAGVVELLCRWRELDMLQGLVGLSATARPFADRLAAIGLRVETVVDELHLVADGYVSPFAEAGVAFGYSDRERQLRAVMASYRQHLRGWLTAVGGSYLRSTFAAIPMPERVSIARRLLRMTSHRTDHDTDLAERFAQWESGSRLRAGELPLVLIVQIARGWSDRDLVAAATTADAGTTTAAQALEELEALTTLRAAAVDLVSTERSRMHLTADRFGTSLDHATLTHLLADDAVPATERWNAARDVLATTAVGSFLSLRDEALRTGEGRVHTIASIIDAERSTRADTRVVVFERGGALHVRGGVAAPGFRGVAGTFAALLDDVAHTAMAVLPHELYLPAGAPPIAPAIASYVRSSIIGTDLVAVLVEQLCSGVDLDLEHRAALAQAAAEAMATLVAVWAAGGSAQVRDINRHVLAPLRRFVRSWSSQPRVAPSARAAVAERLGAHHPHVQAWVEHLLGHAKLAATFERALTAQVRTPAGELRSVEIVRLPPGKRRQLAYELVARLVDGVGDARVPSIDTIVVSSWARGGWNVLTPNVLIDATATRDPVAWQQLRGRALRPAKTWTPVHRQRLVQARRVWPDGARRAVELLRARNKVAHVYELLKGYGGDPQIRFDAHRGWMRTPALAAKHRRELAVDLRHGEMSRDDAHAGLVVAADPRTDSPAALRRALTAVLRGADARIVRRWLDAAAAASPPAEVAAS